jgi:GT2 family glycosyltransferase
MSIATEHDRFTPMDVLAADIGEPGALERLGRVLGESPAQRALVLIRMCGEPIGSVVISPAELSDDPGAALALLRSEIGLAESRHSHAVAAGSAVCGWRDRVLGRPLTPEPISLVICTAGRPTRLRDTLRTVADIQYPDFELILVDNAPRNDVNRRLLDVFEGRFDARYVVERTPGLAHARNTAMEHSDYPIVAFTDDDVRLDPGWLWGIRLGLELDEDVGAVSGPVLPAEVRSRAQDLFERQGGHSKARGFERTVHRAQPGAQSPYLPLPPFGVGCNMGFRRSALGDIGLFDPALGTGAPAGAGEDTAAITELMVRGWAVAHEPSAVLWHYHRVTMPELAAQRHAYGVGLGAYYTSLLARDPRRLWPLLKLAPTALRAVAKAKPLGTDARTAASTSSAIDRRGILRGPSAYFRGRLSHTDRSQLPS